MKSFYDTPFYISCQRMLRPPFHCLKCASSIIPLPIFKPCFGKCILYHTSVIDYALLSAIIVYNTPQSSTGWKHIYYRQWCQCWSVLIGLLEKKKKTKRHLFSAAGQVSVGSHFLVLFTLCWNPAASAPGPRSFRTASLEVVSWGTQFEANSSTDLAFHKLCKQVFTLSH